MRSVDVIHPGPDGKIGRILFIVHHALVKKGKNGGRDITLVKATVLCKFDYPVTRGKKAKRGMAGAADKYGASSGERT